MFVPITFRERETLDQFIRRCGGGQWEVVVERAYNKKRWEVWLYREHIPVIQIGLYRIKWFADRRALSLLDQMNKIEAGLIEESWVRISPEEFVDRLYGKPTDVQPPKSNVIPFRRKGQK